MNSSLHVLIVEDEVPISQLIQTTLENAGFTTDTAFDGEDAAMKIEQGKYDLILLDIMLPKINGYELLKYIRPTGTPVICLTAKGQLNDKIYGLRMGADDYMVKPFQVGELLARIEAVLRRSGKAVDILRFDDVEVNLVTHQVLQNGKSIEMTNKEFDLLVELIRNKNVALTRAALYEHVWQEPYLGNTRTLDCHIQRIRQKLNWNDKIKTIFRIGYRLEV